MIALVGVAVWKLRPAPKPEAAQPSEKTQYWISGMHPWIIMPEPGQCPICGMDLVPLDPAKFSSEIAINPVTVQNIGIRVEPVTSGPLTKTIRTVGIVDYDEENVRDVNTKVSGWIEDLYVKSMGARVEKGEPLFSIYSPELYSAQQDYLIARRSGNATLAEAARTRLQYLDVGPEQIDDLAKRGVPAKTIKVSSPFTGVVTMKHANEGMKIDPGMQTYRIADLSKVWVMATVYEHQLPYLEQGQRATMTLEYLPGEPLEGTVAYIYPYLDKKTREAQIRLEFDNPNGMLKPGMFASVELHNQLAAEATLVPRSAIIDSGTAKVAFVSLGNGRFSPRKVTTGLSTDGGMIQVLSGLQEGESVVTSGQFLLDSEANMREALAKMIEGTPAIEPRKETPAPGKLSPAAESAISNLLEPYLVIQTKLAADSVDGVSEAASKLVQAIGKVELSEPRRTSLTELAQNLAGASDLAAARLAFGKLSVPLNEFISETGVPNNGGTPLLSMHCPMYFENQGGAVWLQAAGDIRNPYMGSRMLACFDDRTILPWAETTAPAQP